MSFKLEISAVKGPTEMLAMSRISVELDNTALHVAAACLDCTPCGAREKISRLEASTSYGCEGKTQLGLADLDETVPSFKEDGFKALKPPLHLAPTSSTGGKVTCLLSMGLDTQDAVFKQRASLSTMSVTKITIVFMVECLCAHCFQHTLRNYRITIQHQDAHQHGAWCSRCCFQTKSTLLNHHAL